MVRAAIIQSGMRYFVAYVLSVRDTPCVCPRVNVVCSDFRVMLIDFEGSVCS